MTKDGSFFVMDQAFLVMEMASKLEKNPAFFQKTSGFEQGWVICGREYRAAMSPLAQSPHWPAERGAVRRRTGKRRTADGAARQSLPCFGEFNARAQRGQDAIGHPQSAIPAILVAPPGLGDFTLDWLGRQFRTPHSTFRNHRLAGPP
jgi:hypothetical protein